MKTDQQIKKEATKKMKAEVMKNCNTADNILALCSDGWYVRYFWKSLMDWSPWQKL